MWAVDPHRPRIDGADITCPACGQTYDVIAAGFHRMPLAHYPPSTRQRRSIGINSLGHGHSDPDLCPVRADELLRVLFIAQLAAERNIRKEAA